MKKFLPPMMLLHKKRGINRPPFLPLQYFFYSGNSLYYNNFETITFLKLDSTQVTASARRSL